ncbi:MAG: hypothetical protein APF77_22380 [Clostridia bacterium BRH_c25]|nr:MAG: hypothetical protein APF77_22380 [Clostridia bacterium BRH_c25]
MKKIITMLLVGLLVLSSSMAVFAEEPGDTLTENFLEEEQHATASRFGMRGLKEFTEEIHQINTLRIERNQLRAQVIEKQDQLIDLYINARGTGNKEALEAAKEERQQIKVINDEMKVLYEQAAVTRKAFREAVKSNDMEKANTEIEKLIGIHSHINGKKEEKIELLDNIIDILS